jgi:regulator of RNase E activity RraA
MDIRPNDYLMGDINGVLVLPREMVEEVLKMMKVRAEKDEKVRAALDRGREFKEASAKFR